MIKIPHERTPSDQVEVIAPRPGGLGTFGGVFTPSILTILGVIMYLRLGWVVGNVGLFGTLVIVSLSTTITFLTALSVAEIATDQQVSTGGAYYMISRSLGIDVGGAIGIPLFLAQGLSVALYTVGFAESLVAVFPALDQRMVGLVVTVLVAVLALISARVAIRAQYFIMAAIAISLLSLLFGSAMPGAEPSAPGAGMAAVATSAGFWPVFAVFFPAVTGIMAGVNMSGDLQDPGRSIPIGTFAAVGVGFLIYMGIPFILAARVDAATLIADPLVMRRISLWGNAILLGVWGATLSSAVGSILGAPRVLQALARDRVLPRPFRAMGRGSGPDETPRYATIFTLVIALAAVYFGSLNVIAPILTMFFLTTYGALNVAAGTERLIRSPSFRPRFRVHWSLSLLGAFGCLAVMFLINPLATVVAALFVLGVFAWLKRRGIESAWGDVKRGVWMAITRAGLLRLRTASEPKNWRPHILVLSGAPTSRWHLIDLANSFTHGRGLMTVSTVLPSDSISADRQQNMETTIHEYLSKRAIQGLVRVVSASDPFAGAGHLVDTYGLGALVPNTVLLGDSEKPEHRHDYCEMIRHFFESRRNVLIVRHDEERGFGDRKRIDVWWGGLKGNGALMAIMAYMLQTALSWPDSTVHLRMIVPTEAAAEDTRPNLISITERMRTGASPQVIVAEGKDVYEIIREESQGADVVFMGMREPGDGFDPYFEGLREKTVGLPTTVFVLAAEEIAFRDVLR
jgi:amino acid transporter